MAGAARVDVHVFQPRLLTAEVEDEKGLGRHGGCCVYSFYSFYRVYSFYRFYRLYSLYRPEQLLLIEKEYILFWHSK